MNMEIKELPDENHGAACRPGDIGDAEAGFVRAVKDRNENVRCIYVDGELVGVLQFAIAKNAFLYIYVFPEFRKAGIGQGALRLCEEEIRSSGGERVSTLYRADCVAGRLFAGKSGYRRTYSMSYMEYSGARFAIKEQPIRYYRDEDYESAHEMYAKAFHEMRVAAGDFPDSVIEKPSGKMREYWDRTANERLVYTKDGRIIGYAHVTGAEIGSVAVGIPYQGHGIGRGFVKYICNKILEKGNDVVTLYCVAGNPAKRLYESLGFREKYVAENAVKSASEIVG